MLKIKHYAVGCKPGFINTSHFCPSKHKEFYLKYKKQKKNQPGIN